MNIPKLPDNWIKILLAGGLLLVLLQGVVLHPDVRLKLLPEAFWLEKISQAQKECLRIEKYILGLQDNLAPLGLAPDPGNLTSEVGQLVLRADHRENLAKNFVEKQLFLARRCYVNAERKLAYMELLLPILETAHSHTPIALSGSDPKPLKQDQALSVLRQRCHEYRKVLDELAQKIKSSNESGNNLVKQKDSER
jgi:hypothetical protein